ncbi:M20/M25/M40 family metallo-hydrolase [Lacticaseibacillus manihotivorans]|uniref:Peptidase M20 n=2 Tax=Lacticaseibacillus manihotivorans TaxID=88233 RepID=A0A0R1QIP1_9LACO|nr:M20/M25/M40 family metallo-hydrolase [Lacticaseibacillus manihotivorans]KRL44457.1 peptidase M20 [Lacticaseibacillus manihotivorans DSM 13343 = JCM 12514]QFQ92101.1 M20/M25/M40 family metallo-hydrolase [Lacticaseibacillus manihotivorans]
MLPQIEFLKQYLSFQSVSLHAHNQIQATAEFLRNHFESIGAQNVQILTTDVTNPAVYAEIPAQVPSDITVLFYNHYDVQPAEPLDLWDTDPFKLAEHDGKLFARGINDDKGELAARLAAIDDLRQAGKLPVNVKFLVEGAEEQGSPHLEVLLNKYAELLKADFCLWESGGKDENGELKFSLGVKGGVAFQLTARNADHDLHSSLGAITENPAWHLVQALATLKNDAGEITIPGFYEDIIPLTPTQKQIVADSEFDYATYAKNAGLTRPATTDNPAAALVDQPSFTINGLSSGYEGPGTGKMILPHVAVAKLDFRIVPGQTVEHTIELVRQALDANGFEDIEISGLLGEPAFRSDPDHPLVQAALNVARDAYPDGVSVVLNSSGSGPMPYFYAVNHAPIISVGISNANSAAHGPNENVTVADYMQFIDYLKAMLPALATNS